MNRGALLFFACLFLKGIADRKASGDIDLQTCIANFDVHTDKIIRTQDSRNMGARYLNEMDLDSREECLRLCCETDKCDVFVFEEKSTGSCYLFECGPPEDFKCKFTHHANYTSAVLAISRYMSNLESQIKLTKHENDLTKLRTPEVHTIHQITKQNVQTTPNTITATARGTITITSKETSNEHERKCSRYQFECRSSGECIAIYNACDGIVQCSDGSDEGPELGCPESTTTIRSPPIYPPPNDRHSNVDHRETQYSQQFKAPFTKQQLLQTPQGEGYGSEGDFLKPVSDTRNSERLLPPSYENPQLSYPNNVPVENTNGWISHPNSPSTNGRNGRIFSHTENGLQVPPRGSEVRMHYQESDGRNYNPQPLYSDSYQNPVDHHQQNWPLYRQGNKIYEKNSYEPEARSSIPSSDWQMQRHSNSHEVNSDNSDIKLPLHANEHHDPQESEKLAQDLKLSKHTVKTSKSKEPSTTKQTEQPTEELSHHSSYKTEKVEKDYVEVARYKLEDSDLNEFEDGLAQTPGGAALSLTLGLLITCVMAILIACRLRVVRRRIRKGGKGYAHDADYLVNGMYL